MYIAKNVNQSKCSSIALNYDCSYRLHKKVDYVCIVQFCMRNCTIYHRLALYHDGLLRRLYLVVDGVVCAPGLTCMSLYIYGQPTT